jgi:hypothetical protein
VEAPQVRDDAEDEILFGFTDGAIALVEVGDESVEGCGIFVEEEIEFGAESMADTVAARGGFARGTGGAGALF